MRTIDNHIIGSFALSFVLTLVIFTFVISIGAIFEIVALLARGVAWKPVVLILLWGFPSALTFSVPMSALTASLLVFGKMSADGEITAMKACGLNLWRVMRLPLLLSMLLTVVCLFINDTLSPKSHQACRRLIASLGVRTPVELLEEGRFINDFAGLTIYIGKKRDNRIYNVRIYDMRDPDATREIQAASGTIAAGENGKDLVAELFDVSVDPFSDSTPGPGFLGRTVLTIPNAVEQRAYRVREKDMSVQELFDGMVNTAGRYPRMGEEDLARQRMTFAVEMNKRLCLSLACFAFVLLGIPLGIRAHRKESTAGIAISLFLVFNFYLFVIVAEALSKQPALRPDLIVWCPVIISIALGSHLVARSN